MNTEGGLVKVYPVPGLVTAMLTMWPPVIVAVPIGTMLGNPAAPEVPTPTLTV